jgi:hypothetical protein
MPDSILRVVRTELALHAYVFLGNALNLIFNRAGAPERTALDASVEELHALYAKVEPLTPQTIMGGVGAFPPEERRLLLDVSLWCIERLDGELQGAAGVTEAEAREVIAWLEKGVGGT